MESHPRPADVRPPTTHRTTRRVESPCTTPGGGKPTSALWSRIPVGGSSTWATAPKILSACGMRLVAMGRKAKPCIPEVETSHFCLRLFAKCAVHGNRHHNALPGVECKPNRATENSERPSHDRDPTQRAAHPRHRRHRRATDRAAQAATRLDMPEGQVEGSHGKPPTG